jgi:hypothetical protein
MSRLAGLKMSKWHRHGVSVARDMMMDRSPASALFPAFAGRRLEAKPRVVLAEPDGSARA